MNITKHSKSLIAQSAAYWSVGQEFYDTMYRYLVDGLPPGSFFTALLANDLFTAVRHSHPSNDIDSLKRLTGWIQNSWPKSAWGSYVKVDKWCETPAEVRRDILIKHQLIYSQETEIMLALKGEPASIPLLF